jgi:hypothetical protein
MTQEVTWKYLTKKDLTKYDPEGPRQHYLYGYGYLIENAGFVRGYEDEPYVISFENSIIHRTKTLREAKQWVEERIDHDNDKRGIHK